MTLEKIQELENYFKSVDLPKEVPIRVGKITDVKGFIKSHLSICRAQHKNNRYKIYFDRLQGLKKYLQNEPKGEKRI